MVMQPKRQESVKKVFTSSRKETIGPLGALVIKEPVGDKDGEGGRDNSKKVGFSPIIMDIDRSKASNNAQDAWMGLSDKKVDYDMRSKEEFDNEDELDIIHLRSISQLANSLLGRSKGSRGTRSNKKKHEDRAKEKAIINVVRFFRRSEGEDFFFGGLGQAGNTDNAVGSNVTMANVMQIPGLNTFGISLVRIDYAVGGINPPHTHPRATEVLVLLEGQLLVGFIDTTNKFFSKTLEKGDVFVFPKALVHFQQNVGHENAVAIAALSSQLPGAQTIANSLFAADPPLPDSVLAKAFRITQELADYIQKKFA
ncbi:germin-like protein 1-1 [Cryptomeria japonica]|uniref:germin-like protein 1-1 n=1 Tax=Cryptomeria japonica TaxID=3369 RepID=UPI0027D9D9F1|nr:germin-like protein 1-1 [Cryptomeria japonica]